MKQKYFTKEGLENLKKELKRLKEKKRPYLVKRVTKAREMGDLSENSEYSSAREELSILDLRIKEIEANLKIGKVIKKHNKKTISLGSKVSIKTKGKSYVFTIVGELEADPLNQKISHHSPLGKALLGKKPGEIVEIQAPLGKIIYQIEKIS